MLDWTNGTLAETVMSLYELVSTYGYLAIGIGTFLEGETILVLGGFAAHQGYLDLPWVLASAFLGTLLGDQLYYYIGRSKGQLLLKKRPKWQYKSKKVIALLQKHDALLIFGFRFLYGLRTVTPFVLGLSRISPVRFSIFNILGASTWAIGIGFMGYIFGHTFELLMGNVKRYELWILIGSGLLGSAVWVYRHFSNQKDH
jgi:membrane protein DedA with SNARE-associated domain